MVSASLSDVLRRLRRSAFGRAGTASEDRELLERFLAQRDQAAFELLLGRHGPMVLGVCRRLLAEEQDAEDAFQATFLVLLKKAGSLKRREALAAWLHGVACRTALKARGLAARRRTREKQVDPMPEPAAAPSPTASELREVIDQELARLPAKFRAPVTLCYLEGKTFTEAAEHLGWPAGTVSGRLARARQLLHARLSRRGITLSATALAAALAEEVRAVPVPSVLRSATIRAALGLAGGNSTALPFTVTVLMEGVLHAMWISKLKAVTTVAVVSLFLSMGAGLAYQRLTAAGQEAADKSRVSTPSLSAPQTEPKTARNVAGTFVPPPLPALSAEAAKALVARAPVSDKMRGLLQDLFAAAESEAQARWGLLMMGRSVYSDLLPAMKRLLAAESALSSRKLDQVAAAQRHVDRLKKIEELAQIAFNGGRVARQDLEECRFYRIEAEIRLERAKAGRIPAPED